MVAIAAAVLTGGRMLGRSGVPVLTVRPQRFHRAVAADGVLRAVRSTPITCPAELRQSLKIAWLLPDGTPVKAGDVVVRLDSTDAEKALKESEATVAQVDQRLAKAAAQAQASRRALEREAGLAARELDGRALVPDHRRGDLLPLRDRHLGHRHGAGGEAQGARRRRARRPPRGCGLRGGPAAHRAAAGRDRAPARHPDARPARDARAARRPPPAVAWLPRLAPAGR